jgi:uncharacterized membrane protein YccC
VMSYSLLLFNYTASVVFTSSYVLLMFHLLAPGSMRIIGERAIDTLVGCAIAIAASHLFPYWEYRLMGKLVNSMIAATRQYLEASWWWGGKPEPISTAVVTEAGGRAAAAAMATSGASFGEAGTGRASAVTASATTSQSSTALAASSTPAAASDLDAGSAALASSSVVTLSNPTAASSAGASSGSAASAAASAAAQALERDYRYRLARKNVHVAFANLGQAFQRMMLEPKAAQKFVPELNDLLVRSHVLASQITAAAPLLRISAQQPETVSLQPLQRVLSVVRDNLTEAEAGTMPSADQTEATRQLARELDTMVVDAEKSPDYAADAVHELKLLAHQCKQMLTAANLIRRDASIIRLPDA